jgi:hypothetical protein
MSQVLNAIVGNSDFTYNYSKVALRYLISTDWFEKVLTRGVFPTVIL